MKMFANNQLINEFQKTIFIVEPSLLRSPCVIVVHSLLYTEIKSESIPRCESLIVSYIVSSAVFLLYFCDTCNSNKEQ